VRRTGESTVKKYACILAGYNENFGFPHYNIPIEGDLTKVVSKDLVGAAK
jgi:hypothetical protein